MLFVKDMLFLDGAVATMAPEIDLLGEIAVIAAYFAQHHGERIAADVGVDVRTTPIDLDGVRASMGCRPTPARSPTGRSSSAASSCARSSTGSTRARSSPTLTSTSRPEPTRLGDLAAEDLDL